MTLLREKKSTQPVAKLACAPGDHCGRFARKHRFETALCGEVHRCPVINPEGHHPLLLLPEQLAVRLARARGDTPVDVANLIPGLIGAGLIKLHATSPEPGEVGTAGMAAHPNGSQWQITSLPLESDKGGPAHLYQAVTGN